MRCLVDRETVPGSAAITQQNIACLGPVLSFDLGDRVVMAPLGQKPYFHAQIHLFGTQTRHLGHACLSGHVLGFAIFFQPFALWQLFGIRPGELVDHDGDATEVLGSWIAEFWHKLGEAQTFPERVALATETLLGFLKADRPLTPIMSTVHRLLPSNEAAKIYQVARESAMSIRSYERQFVREMGFSPKMFARLVRFEKAVDMKRLGGDSWLNEIGRAHV